MVKAFQFMDQKTNKYLNEEVSPSVQEAIVALNGESYAVDNNNMWLVNPDLLKKLARSWTFTVQRTWN